MTIGYAHSKLVARLRALASLTDADLTLLERLPIKLQNLGAGHDIVREGDIVQQCCAVADGFLFRHRMGAEGKRQIVSWHIPGDIPDLYSLHLDPMDHNITTLGPAVVGFIPHEPFKDILQRSPALTHVFWRETLVDAAGFREQVVSLGKRDALARIAHMICDLLTRLHGVGIGLDMHFQFPASQVDVADATGMTSIHANRMIQQLRARGMIEWEGPRIRVLDFDALKALAEFDDGYLHLRAAG